MSSRIILGIALSIPFVLQAAPKKITTCVDDRPWMPYTNPDPKTPGTMQERVFSVAKTLAFTVEDKGLPWKRCQASVKAGDIDAMIGGGYVEFNREFSDFPMKGSDVDTKRALGSARVMLVKRLGDKANFDGKVFSNMAKSIGVAAGTQVMVVEAKKFGGKVDEGAKTDEQNIQKLIDGRVDLMAGYEFDLKDLIEKKFKGKVEILPVPLIETHYYLAFSKKFTEKNKDFVESIWNEFGKTNP